MIIKLCPLLQLQLWWWLRLRIDRQPARHGHVHVPLPAKGSQRSYVQVSEFPGLITVPPAMTKNTLASSHRIILPIHTLYTACKLTLYNQKCHFSIQKTNWKNDYLHLRLKQWKKVGECQPAMVCNFWFKVYPPTFFPTTTLLLQTSPPENFITQNSQRRKINPGLTSFIQECLLSTAKWMTHLTTKYSSSFYVVLIYFKTCSTFTQADTFLPQTFKWSNFGWNPTKCQISDVCILWII